MRKYLYLSAVVFLEIAIKIMGKLPVDSLNSLSESVSGKGGPSTTETIGNNHSKFGKTFSQHRERKTL